MLKSALKTTTALALCAGLATPPAFAQQTAEELPPCALAGQDNSFPCVLEDGKKIKNAKQLAKALAAQAIEGQGGAAEAPEGGTAPGAVTADAPAPDAPAPAAEAAPEPAPEAAPAPAEVPAADPAVEPEPEILPEADAVPAVNPAPADTPAAEAAPKPKAADKPTKAAPAATPAATEAKPKKPKDKAAAGGQSPSGPSAAAAAEAAAAATGTDELLVDPSAGAVTTETVTEADVRRSAEDFASAPTGGVPPSGEAATAPSAKADDSNDTFQKGLLIGLGALAVGAILYNGAKVVSNSGDRVVVEQPDGSYTVLKNDDQILRRPGSEVQTQTYDDGSTRNVVTQPDGVRIVTIRAADGTAIKRVRVMPDGTRYVLFDDTVAPEPVGTLPAARPAPGITATGKDALHAALIASMADRDGRRYGLSQIRAYPSVRALAPEIEVRAITFPTNSAAIPPAQAERLADLGLAIARVIAEVPGAVFLVEGHTDAIGSDAYNLALSDRRAESVALALGEYFGVPPENLVMQGYGESDLKVDTDEANRQNRRVVVRNITPLLR